MSYPKERLAGDSWCHTKEGLAVHNWCHTIGRIGGG